MTRAASGSPVSVVRTMYTPRTIQEGTVSVAGSFAFFADRGGAHACRRILTQRTPDRS